MRLTAKDNVDIADGVYPATWLDLTEIEPSETSFGDKPYLRWIFAVYDDEDTVELVANSSMNFGTKAKCRRWIQAILGRVIAPGETIEPLTLLPRDCQVVVKNDQESGFCRIEDVLGEKKKGTRKRKDSEPDEEAGGVLI